MKYTHVILAIGLLFSGRAQAKDAATDSGYKIGLLGGLLQPIFTQGGNIQLEAVVGRFVLDYSHGWSLHLPPSGSVKDQQLELHLPYSTGLGIGYRFTDALDLRLEPKLHKFNVRYDNGASTDPTITTYRTITLGLGLYYKWHPFNHSNGTIKGITVAPSLRWWPNIWSSLDKGRHIYTNSATGQQEIHKTANIGIGGTPFIFNISVGYEFSL